MTSLDWYPREFILPTTDAERDAIKVAQRVLSLEQTGELNPATMAAIRGIQGQMGLVKTGFLDMQTARVIDAMQWG